MIELQWSKMKNEKYFKDALCGLSKEITSGVLQGSRYKRYAS